MRALTMDELEHVSGGSVTGGWNGNWQILGGSAGEVVVVIGHRNTGGGGFTADDMVTHITSAGAAAGFGDYDGSANSGIASWWNSLSSGQRNGIILCAAVAAGGILLFATAPAGVVVAGSMTVQHLAAAGTVLAVGGGLVLGLQGVINP